MVQFLRELSTALAPWRSKFVVHLLMDVAPCHLVEQVLQEARKQRFRLVFVPARLSSILQPLDTHAFASFKSWLERQHQQLRAQYSEGLVPEDVWLSRLLQAPEEFFGVRSWASAFDAVGATGRYQSVTRVLRQYASSKHMLCSKRPSADDMSVIWPKRRRMAYAPALLFA